MHAHSRARQVVLSAPFWVINKTNLELQVADTTPNGGLPVTCRPGLHDVAMAVPFRWAKLTCLHAPVSRP